MDIGLDAHKRVCDVVGLSPSGDELLHVSVRTTRGELARLARDLPAGSRVAVEASTSGKFVARVLGEAGVDVVLAHPLEVRRRAGRAKKTDALDARVLADLLRMNWLPRAYLPSPEEDSLRTLLRHRLALGRKAAMVKQRVHALLDSQGVHLPFSDLFGKQGAGALRRLRLSDVHQRVLEDALEQLDLLARQIARVQDHLAKVSLESDAVRRLMTMPGIDFYSALVLPSEIGDVTRFPDAKHLCSYAGLVPRVAQSGDVTRRGGIHKQGPKALRWITVMCARAAVKARNSKWRRIYLRLSKRIGKGKAIVAVARRMLAVVFALRTQGGEYVEKDPKAHGRKVRTMRRRARELPPPRIADRLGHLSPVAVEMLMEEVGLPG